MGKKILDSKLLYIALSIVIAVFLWFYATATDTQERSKPIYNVPVTFTGVDILEDRSLMIVGGSYTATVRVRATPMLLASLDNKTVQVVANVSSISTVGPHTVSYEVKLPTGVPQNQVVIESGLNGNVINVEVAQFSRREVEVRGRFLGSAAEGYLAGDNDDFLFSPTTVWVSGQQELVNQVSHALVTVDETGLTESVSGDYPFQLIGASNNVLDLDIECDVETVYISFPVQATATIPFAVNFISGGGVDASEATYELSTEAITVAGSREAVEALSAAGAINLATIDLSTVQDGDEKTFPVPLADELTNITGVSEVTVTISLNKKLETRTLEVSSDRFSFVNVPEGWSADFLTQILPIEIRGSSELVAELTEENIRVVANLESITLVANQYSVPVDIYLDVAPTASEVGKMSADYRIYIDFYEGEPRVRPDDGET